MKLFETIEKTFKKGTIYSPDAMDDLPRAAGCYFTDQEEAEEGKEKLNQRLGEYEYGSLICTESFKIEIKIFKK